MVENVEASNSYLFFTILIEAYNTHEVNQLRGKLWKYGFIKHEDWTYGTDQWNRPKLTQATFTLIVQHEKSRALKAMLKQVDRNTESKITYTQN